MAKMCSKFQCKFNCNPLESTFFTPQNPIQPMLCPRAHKFADDIWCGKNMSRTSNLYGNHVFEVTFKIVQVVHWRWLTLPSASKCSRAHNSATSTLDVKLSYQVLLQSIANCGSSSLHQPFRHRPTYPPTTCCKLCRDINRYLAFFSWQLCRHYYSLLHDSDPLILLEDLLLGCFISRTTTPVSVFSTGRSRMLCWTVSMAILCCNQVFK